MPENKYYSDKAYKIKWARYCWAAFSALFIFMSVLLNYNELNPAGFGYILGYINSIGSNRAGTGFYLELEETAAVGYFRNNIAVLRKNRIDIYDANGRRNFNQRLAYSNPAVKSSRRYLLAYDSGSNKMEVFNAFSRIYEYKGDAPIYSAGITNRGNIVYITSESGYSSAVYVMNNKFNIIYRCLFERDFIIAADIDDRAENLAVAGFSARGGDYMSRIILYGTKSPEPRKIIEVPGELPYGVRLIQSENGAANGIFAVFENSLRVYDKDGGEVLIYDFDNRTLRQFSLTDKLAAAVLEERTLGIDNRIIIFGGDGKILYEAAIGAEVTDIRFSEDFRFLYFLTRGGLYEIDIGRRTFEFVTNEYDETADMIVRADGRHAYLSGLVKINVVAVRPDNR
jgi:hypothetical protein